MVDAAVGIAELDEDVIDADYDTGLEYSEEHIPSLLNSADDKDIIAGLNLVAGLHPTEATKALTVLFQDVEAIPELDSSILYALRALETTIGAHYESEGDMPEGLQLELTDLLQLLGTGIKQLDAETLFNTIIPQLRVFIQRYPGSLISREATRAIGESHSPKTTEGFYDLLKKMDFDTAVDTLSSVIACHSTRMTTLAIRSHLRRVSVMLFGEYSIDEDDDSIIKIKDTFTEKDKVSLTNFFLTLEQNIAVFEERDHETLLLLGIAEFLVEHPVLEALVPDELYNRTVRFMESERYKHTQFDEEEPSIEDEYVHPRLAEFTRTLSWLPKPQKQELMGLLHEHIDAFSHGPLYRLLTEVISSKNSQDLDVETLYDDYDLDKDALAKLLNNQAVFDVISLMLRSPQHFKFQIGALLTLIPVQQLPPEVLLRLKPIAVDQEMKLSSQRGAWWLCGSAEPLFVESLSAGLAVVVNDHLVLKALGKASALCTRTVTTPAGFTFYEGCWYSPVDQPSRHALDRALMNGAGRIYLDSSDAEWAYMRPATGVDALRISADHILEEARNCALHLPNRMPDSVGGVSRNSLIEGRCESHGDEEDAVEEDPMDEYFG